MRLNKYGRELELLLLLTDNNNYTAQQIADKLGITRRSLYYYFDYLRESGFRLQKSGTRYSLDRDTSFFRRLHESISLNDKEAAYIVSLLDDTGNRSPMASAVRTKLARTFGLADATNPAVLKRVNANTAVLKDAIARKQIVILKNYSSPHSSTVTDRTVEPFLIMDGGLDVRCHEVSTHTNKTFKISRAESVEMLDVPWIHESSHKNIYTDLFMFSGEQRQRVVLRLGQLSRNLLVEEYPAAEPFISADGQQRWLFDAEVVSFLGIGRFVLGLYEDIDVLGSTEFRKYIAEKVEAYSQKQV